MDTAHEALQQSHGEADTVRPRGEGDADVRWPVGCLVRVRGRRWRVREDRAFTDCHLLRLVGVGRVDGARSASLLYPFDRPQPLERGRHLRRLTWQQWLRAFRMIVAAATPCGRLQHAASANIVLHAYQLEPALTLLNGMGRRLLIADEVGLGKTIQAALAVSEIHARQPAARSLILTPAGLRDQWACELRERFDFDATVVDAAMLRRTLARIAPGANPWAVWPAIIASFDFVKRPEVLRALDPFTWDVLVVDEAHQCAIAPERSAAVRVLAARARHVLLLTATPHAGDDRAFEGLCDIGRIERDGPIVMFRRNRSDVGMARTRRVHLLRVRCSGEEERVHRLLEGYSRAVWNSPTAAPDARLAMTVLRKRALSSAFALAQSIAHRVAALFEGPSEGDQLALPFAGSAEPDDESPEDDEPTGCLAAPGMDGHRERPWLERLLDAAHAAAKRESKLHRLTRLLTVARQPAIVFTEYRDTARWLASSLRQLPGDVVLLHGGLSRAERRDVERRFRTGQAQVLVATDAAGQGLNLHHRCRLVVNLELPWSPLRLEQRIGRVDRLGQTRRPHAIHLVARHTAEEDIVRRLVVRQERARQRVGEVNDAVGATTEEQVAVAVMTPRGREPSAAVDGAPASVLRPFGPSASSASPGARSKGEGAVVVANSVFTVLNLRQAAGEEGRRLSLARSLMPPASGGMALGTAGTDWVRGEQCVAVLPKGRARRSGLRRGIVCVFVLRGLDALEDVVDEWVVPLHVRATAGFTPRLTTSSDCPAWKMLEQRAMAAALPHSATATEVYRRVTAMTAERERGLATRERSLVPLQPGMFDRRALSDAERAAAGLAAREMERTDRLWALAARTTRLLTWHAELALVLVVP